MVAAVRARGHEYMAITDHSAGVGMGIGLEADDVRRQIEAVQLIRETLDGFDLLAGCEVDVMGDGSLYLPDDVLAELDWVVASLHVAQRQDADRITKRLLAAAEHPSVDVIGHPSGRMIGKREGYAFDVEALVAACAEHGTFLEINAQPHRLDLRPAHARLALAAGVKLVISTDAHRITALDYQELGVFMARRAGATRDDIVNARPLAELNALRKPGRVVQLVSEPDRSSERPGLRLDRPATGSCEGRAPLARGARPADDRGRARVDPGAAAVRRAAHAAGPGRLAALVRADRGAHHARARRLARPRARTPSDAVVPLGQAPAARHPRDDRGRARRRCAAASTRPARRSLAYETRERLGYAAVSVCDREHGAGARRASAPTTTAPACPRRPAPSTR